MGTIVFTFTNQQGTLDYTYNVSDENLARLTEYLRNKYGAAPDRVAAPVSIPVALDMATQEIIQGWKNSTINYEIVLETANVANTIPPLDVT